MESPMKSNGSILRSALALLAGIAADIIGSLIGGIAVGILMSIFLLIQGVPLAELVERLERPSVLVIGGIVGFSFTMLGGYVAARLARRSELLHGGSNAALATLVAWTIPTGSSFPVWLRILMSLATIPIGIFGGWIALAERRRSERWHGERLRAFAEDEKKHEAAEAARSGFRAADRDREL
jgi:hypothetical protein